MPPSGCGCLATPESSVNLGERVGALDGPRAGEEAVGTGRGGRLPRRHSTLGSWEQSRPAVLGVLTGGPAGAQAQERGRAVFLAGRPWTCLFEIACWCGPPQRKNHLPPDLEPSSMGTGPPEEVARELSR